MTNKNCLLFETLGKVSDLKVLESNGDGLMRLTGVFGVCGVRNNNNRIYDKDNYKQMVESLQKVISEQGCPGELEHPNSMNINLENVSHKIESIEMNEDGTITGTIALLNTPKGQIAQAIVEGGLPLFISSRAAGTMTNESGISHVTLSTIKTYDLVGTPGFSQAMLTLKENQTLECLNESSDEGNIMYAIVEGEKEEKKEDEEPKGEENKSDQGSDDDNDNKDNKDNKNIDNEDIDMKELKEAIDKLSEKVTALEAELHVAQESLNETKSSIPTINYDAIQTWVTEEFGTDFKQQLIESIGNSNVEELIDNRVNEAIQTIADNIQNWVVEEFAPEVQDWVCEEFAPEVQNWVVEEFAPEVQNWITEEYSPEVQNWITEEFAPVIDKWVNEEFAPEHTENIEKKVNENVSAFLAENKAGRLEEIDSLLETIGSNGTPLEDVVKENQKESKWKGFVVVEQMPAQFKPSWEMLDEARQEEIVRSSRMYDFTKEGVLESFWANQDFEKKTKENIQENLNPSEQYQNNIVNQMMKLRRAF